MYTTVQLVIEKIDQASRAEMAYQVRERPDGEEIDFTEWCDFFSEVSSFVDTLERQYGLANCSFTEHAIMRLSTTIRSLQSIEESLDSHDDSPDDLQAVAQDVREMVDVLTALQTIWCDYQESIQSRLSVQRVPPVLYSRRRGRPRFDVTQEQIEHLRYLSFSWTSISSMLGISRMTLYRRKKEYGLSSMNRSMTDSELDACVRDIRKELPYSGETIIMGSMPCCVPRKRVRECLRRIDPLNTPLRWIRSHHRRRPYSVPGPNSLWHLGEQHARGVV